MAMVLPPSISKVFATMAKQTANDGVRFFALATDADEQAYLYTHKTARTMPRALVEYVRAELDGYDVDEGHMIPYSDALSDDGHVLAVGTKRRPLDTCVALGGPWPVPDEMVRDDAHKRQAPPGPESDGDVQGGTGKQQAESDTRQPAAPGLELDDTHKRQQVAPGLELDGANGAGHDTEHVAEKRRCAGRRIRPTVRQLPGSVSGRDCSGGGQCAARPSQ
jgi:hypothetical protein